MTSQCSKSVNSPCLTLCKTKVSSLFISFCHLLICLFPIKHCGGEHRYFFFSSFSFGQQPSLKKCSFSFCFSVGRYWKITKFNQCPPLPTQTHYQEMKFQERLHRFFGRLQTRASVNCIKARHFARFILWHTCWCSLIVGAIILTGRSQNLASKILRQKSCSKNLENKNLEFC